MNRTITNAFIFVAGAVAGSLATWKYVETKYKKIAQEEIDSVKEAFSRTDDTDEKKKAEEPGDESKEDPEPRRVERVKYTELVSSLGYSDQEGGTPMVGAIRVIPPHDFGNADGYEIETLTYYADGVLTDDWDHPIEDIDGYVGEDFHTHFGEYEEDAVHIRNDILQKDFEILKDLANFSEITKHHYHLVAEDDA